MPPETKKQLSVYESLFKNSTSIMLIINPVNGDILDANQTAFDFYQYSKKELLKLNISQINTLSEQEIKKELNDAKRQHRNHFNFRHQLKNGEIKPVEVRSGPIEYQNKTVLYSIIHDISEKNQAQEALKKSEETIRAMINATDNMVYLVDLKGKIINLNTPGAQLFDKHPYEMIGNTFDLFFTENDFSRLTLLVKDVVENHKSVSYQKKRGERYLNVNIYPVFNKNKLVNRVCVFINDITDLKKTEKVLAAIETAGGICHEMNQPLQVILGNLEILKMNLKKNDPNLKLINVILSQTQKIGLITKKLTHITRYETKGYMKGTIFDIDKSSEIK